MDFDKRRIDYFVDGQHTNTIVMTPDIHTLWAAMTWQPGNIEVQLSTRREHYVIMT